nr:hypothetical protein [Actinomycetales bacterium]
MQHTDGTQPTPFDVFLHGPIFFDLVFTGLPSLPIPGTEIHTEGMGSLPGGIANLAVASARLGLDTSLAAGFGNDVYGGWCRTVLIEEGVDLSKSRTFEQHTNVTVSMSHAGDRAMVTHGHELPICADELITSPPPTRAVVTDLTGERANQHWWRAAVDAGAWVFADVGWDDSGAWRPSILEPLEHCHAFAPNASEAMAYTRASSPEAALASLSERVPLAVVTLGADGAIARDRETGEEARAVGIPLELVDPTGAGDNFVAALVYGRLAGWPLQRVLDFAVLCSGLSVTQFGGSLSAPGWGDIASWYDHVTGRIAAGAAPRCPCTMHVQPDDALASRFAFLDGAVPNVPLTVMRRAEGTFALEGDPTYH